MSKVRWLTEYLSLCGRRVGLRQGIGQKALAFRASEHGQTAHRQSRLGTIRGLAGLDRALSRVSGQRMKLEDPSPATVRFFPEEEPTRAGDAGSRNCATQRKWAQTEAKSRQQRLLPFVALPERRTSSPLRADREGHLGRRPSQAQAGRQGPPEGLPVTYLRAEIVASPSLSRNVTGGPSAERQARCHQSQDLNED